MIGGQILIIFIGGRAFSVIQLNRAQWAYSIVLGALSIPIGVIIRLIPDELFSRRICAFEGANDISLAVPDAIIEQ
jgi:P-type Ca2+ transporter type 2C